MTLYFVHNINNDLKTINFKAYVQGGPATDAETVFTECATELGLPLGSIKLLIIYIST